MPASSTTIRLFVSSTFDDFKAERDALQRDVFPKLRQLCLSRGLRFQAIDLRWGISEEAGRDSRTMRICLRELLRCQQDRPKPNFLVLLGNRYGWRPLPELIPAELFEKLGGQLEQSNRAAGELFRASYRLDENARPSVRELKPRGDDPTWHERVEKPLLAALERAAHSFGEELEAAGVFIGASATEQEIVAGALRVSDSPQHVRAVFRSIVGRPSDSLPAAYVDLSDGLRDLGAEQRLEALKGRIEGRIGSENIFPYRARLSADGIDAESLRTFCDGVLGRLSAVVAQQIASPANTAEGSREEQAHQDFGARLRHRFVGRAEPLARVTGYLEQGTGKPLIVMGPYGSGKSALMAMAAARAEERETGSQRPEIIARYLGVTPMSSDIGQLLSNLTAEVRRLYPTAVDETSHRIDDSYQSGQVREADRGDPGVPLEYHELVDSFREAIQRPTAERPLFLFLDALDQLTDSYRAHSLNWLPDELLPHVRLVVSAAVPEESGDDGICGSSEDLGASAAVMAALQPRLGVGRHVVLEPMSVKEGARLLRSCLRDAERTLRPVQRKAILESFRTEGSPLWLRTAAAEASRLASDDPAPAFAPTTAGLLSQVVARLSASEEHGDFIPSRTLSYLACARHGLSEDELLDVLSADPEVMNDFRRRSSRSPKAPTLPVVVWARVHGDLELFLTERHVHGASVLGFYHRSLLHAVRGAFLADNVTRERRHRGLAAYFMRQDNLLFFVGDLSMKVPTAQLALRHETPNTRRFAELPFQLARGGCWRALHYILTQFDFIEAKWRCEPTREWLPDLVNDYRRALSSMPATSASDHKEEMTILLRLLVRLHGECAGSPDRIFPQMYPFLVRAHPRTRLAATVEKHVSALRRRGRPWLRRLDPPSEPPNVVGRLRVEVPPSGVQLCARSAATLAIAGYRLALWDLDVGVVEDLGRVRPPEGLANARKNGLFLGGKQAPLQILYPDRTGKCAPTDERILALAALDDGRAAAITPLGVLIWDPDDDSLRAVHHGEGIGPLRAYPGGGVAWGTRDGEVHLWQSGMEGSTILARHESAITALAITRIGDVLSGDEGGSVHRCHPLTGKHSSLGSPGRSVVHLDCLPDGSAVVALGDDLDEGTFRTTGGTVELWDAEDGNRECVIRHDATVRALVVTPGGTIVSGGYDGSVTLWRAAERKARRVGQHARHIIGLVALSESYIASVDTDGHIIAWDCSQDTPDTLGLEHECTTALVALEDGRVASGTLAGEVKVWDIERAQTSTVLRHSGQVTALAAIPEGVISGGRDRVVRAWSRSGEVRSAMREHTGWIRSLAVVGPGSVVSGSEDGTVRRWDYLTGNTEVLVRHADRVVAVAMFPKSELLSIGGDVILTSRHGSRRIGAGGCVPYSCSLAIHGAQYDDAGVLARLEAGLLATMLQSRLFRILPGGDVIAGQEDGRILLVEGRPPHRESTLGTHPGLRSVAALSPTRVMSVGGDGRLIIWECGSKKAELNFAAAATAVVAVGVEQRIVVGLENGGIAVLVLEGGHVDRSIAVPIGNWTAPDDKCDRGDSGVPRV